MNVVVTVASWAVFGLVIGAIARFIMPGRQNMNLPMTMLLGVVGSFAGGSLASLIFGSTGNMVQAGGWIMSILGALLLLFIYMRVMAARNK